MAAKTPKARIQKGKNLEDYVCEQLKEKEIDGRARRSYGSGNGNGIKADIDTDATVLGRAAGFECKHVDNIQYGEFIKQVDKLDSLGFEPILVLKRTQDDYANTRVVIYLDTLLELIKKEGA